MLDRNVEAVRELLKTRAEVGLKKYGVTTERTDLSERDWLQHALEEALDLAVYLQRVIGEKAGFSAGRAIVEASPSQEPVCKHKRYTVDTHEQTGTCYDCGAQGRMKFVVEDTDAAAQIAELEAQVENLTDFHNQALAKQIDLAVRSSKTRSERDYYRRERDIWVRSNKEQKEQIAKLEAQLADKAAPSQEPVGYWDEGCVKFVTLETAKKYYSDAEVAEYLEPLYTTPPDAAAQIAALREQVAKLEAKNSELLCEPHKDCCDWRVAEKDVQIAKLNALCTYNEKLMDDMTDQIAKLERTWLSPETYERLMQEREETLKQLAASEKDAERYRWLRTQNPRQYQELWNYCLNSDVMFDDQVDELMGAVISTMKLSPGDTVEEVK